LNDDINIESNINSYMDRNNLIIEYTTLDENIWIEELPSDRYIINEDEVIIYDYQPNEHFKLHIGEESDIYEFGSPIGYEFLDDNKVVHIWNTQDDYFFEKDAGIQLTNHYQDYWSRNVFCIGYYNNDEWIKIACVDELTNFQKSIESDNLTYVNATLWKDITYGNYDLRVGVQYHLGLDDENLSITIYGKNIGIDIPYDLGFAWKVKNLDVPSNETIDKILINGKYYNLDEEINLLFKNMTRKETHTNWNKTCLEKCEEYDFECQNLCIINQTYSYESLPFFKIKDNGEGGLLSKENFLRIDWNENLNYAVKMYGNGVQEDFYVVLLINAGHFNPNQEKSTTFYWIDALTDGIVYVWDFNDGSGTNLEEKVSGTYDGTLQNMEEADWKSGGDCVLDGCLEFGGTDEYINFSTGLNSYPNTIGEIDKTWCFWIRTTDISTQQSAFSQREFTSEVPYWANRYDGSKMYFQITTGTGSLSLLKS